MRPPASRRIRRTGCPFVGAGAAFNDPNQAAQWAARLAGRNNDVAEVLHFRVPRSEPESFSRRLFDGPSNDLADFIRHNRDGGAMHGYDLVEGPMLLNVGPFLRRGASPPSAGTRSPSSRPRWRACSTGLCCEYVPLLEDAVPEFLMATEDAEMQAYFREIAEFMVDEFGIGYAEAVARVNEAFKDQEFSPYPDIICHELPEHWAYGLYYGDVPYWDETADRSAWTVRPAPEPGSPPWTLHAPDA